MKKLILKQASVSILAQSKKLSQNKLALLQK